jgi:hypothetical protein
MHCLKGCANPLHALISHWESHWNVDGRTSLNSERNENLHTPCLASDWDSLVICLQRTLRKRPRAMFHS